MSELVVADLKGQSVLKAPGSVAGEGFVIKNLEDCSVYVLDHASEVEVTNCINCTIFVGPVDGPAIFEDCKDCKVAVACQQFRAKTCSDCEFGLYCATQPSITASTNIKFSCWNGAYPGLTQHFAAASLDPKSNNWNKVYDGSAEDGAAPNFVIIEELSSYWEVPLEGAGAADNPVPGPAGQLYTAAVDPDMGNAGNGINEALPEDAFAAPIPADVFGGTEELNGAMDYVPSQPPEDNPRAAAMRDMQRQRLKDQEALEASKKTKLREDAAAYLASFYERRQAKKDARLKENRDKMTPAADTPQGDTQWERVISMIDFQFNKPNADMSRFKSTLYLAKSKNMATAQ